jgi:hypothetical protein
MYCRRERLIARSSHRRELAVSIRGLMLAFAAVALLGGGTVSAAPRAASTMAPAATCDDTDCGAFGTFSGDVRGAVLATRRADGMARVTAGLVTSMSHDTARIIASAKSCSQTHTPADRIFSWSIGATNAGSFNYASATLALDGDLADIGSYRFVGKGGATARSCTLGFHIHINPFQTAASPMAEGAFARFTDPDARGLVILRLGAQVGKAKLSVAVGDLPTDGIHTIYGTRAPCGSPNASGDVRFKSSLDAESDGMGFVASTRTITSKDPYGIRSIRVVEGEGIDGALVACTNGFVILDIDGRNVWVN